MPMAMSLPMLDMDLLGVGVDRIEALANLELPRRSGDSSHDPDDQPIDLLGKNDPVALHVEAALSSLVGQSMTASPLTGEASCLDMGTETLPKGSQSYNVSINSGSSEDESAMDPVERFHTDVERHEQIALSIPVVGSPVHRSAPPEASYQRSKSSSCGSTGLDSSLDRDMDGLLPVRRYVADIQDHELLAYQLGTAGETSPQANQLHEARVPSRGDSPELPSTISLDASLSATGLSPIAVDDTDAPDTEAYMEVLAAVKKRSRQYGDARRNKNGVYVCRPIRVHVKKRPAAGSAGPRIEKASRS